MKLLIQMIGENLSKFPSLLRKIANEIEEEKTCEEFYGEDFIYNYSLEDAGYHRQFLIYSTAQGLEPKNDPIVLGIAFGSSPEEAFEGFCHSSQGKKLFSKEKQFIVIREIIGDPVYKETTKSIDD